MSDRAERHRRLQALFSEACDLEGEARAAFLDEACGTDAELRADLDGLLAQDLARTAGFLASPLPPLGSTSGAEPPLPERIGRYRVLSLLGTGGMGVVYEAEQEQPQRTVALKLLRPWVVTDELLRRFQHEAEVLGWLNHVGIAQIYEAGTAETGSGVQPFIAMELVRGDWIDRYAERESLSIPARLELLAQLCDAVHHAHQKGIVHRDLKPANILVTAQGQLKVLDFGIARITESDVGATTVQTRPGEVLGTLPYMSPEQVAGDPKDIDTRSDVYALGVIAFELLAGEPPLDLAERSMIDAARSIVEDEPTTLGSIDRRLRGDVEVIVGKALAKEKERRYASAEELASDLRRHLKDEPIRARPPSTLYQVKKFSRRHRGLVAGIAVAFLVLLVGAVTSTLLYLQTSRLFVEKSDEARTANEAITFLESIFQRADPFAEDLSVRDAALAAAQRLEAEFVDSPAVRARILDVLGRTLNHFSLYEDSGPLLEEALALRAQQNGEKSLEYAATLAQLAEVRHAQQREEEALALFRRLVALRRALGGEGEELAVALHHQAQALAFFGDMREAARVQEESLAMLLRSPGADPRHIVRVRLGIASNLVNEGMLKDAQELLVELLPAIPERDVGWRVETMAQISNCLRGQRNYGEAERWSRAAVELALEHYGDLALITRRVEKGLAMVLSDAGSSAEAVAIMRDLCDRVIERKGIDSPDAAEALHDLAFCVHEVDPGEAEGLYLEALERFENVFGPDDLQVFQTQHNLSVLYNDLGRYADAEPYSRASLLGRARVLGEDHAQTIVSKRGLAYVLEHLGRPQEAAGLRRDVLEFIEPAHGEHAPSTQDARIRLAHVLVGIDAYEEAEVLLERARSALAGMDDPAASEQRIANGFVELYLAWGRPQDAERWRVTPSSAVERR